LRRKQYLCMELMGKNLVNILRPRRVATSTYTRTILYNVHVCLSVLFLSIYICNTAITDCLPGLHSCFMHAYQPDCRTACLPVCLAACLPVCMSACLLVSLSMCLPVCMSAWLPVCLSAWLHACLSACLPACLSACLCVCLSACLTAVFPGSLFPLTDFRPVFSTPQV
jgi:hypothetical protein